jgi:hypothetical protein
MLQAEMSQDVVPCAFDASFPADHSVEAAEVPTPPTQDVLPKALPVALSLIKPASTFVRPRDSSWLSLPIIAELADHLGLVRRRWFGVR